MALQPDGKIVIAGSAMFTSNLHFALARFQPNGLLDTTFGGDGRVRTNFPDHAEALAIAMQPNDGRLVVAGYTNTAGSGFANRDFALTRYHAFTCGGMVVTRIGTAGNDTITGTSGKDVIYGFGGDDFIDGLERATTFSAAAAGNDILEGGGGDDILRGGSGTDICRGESHLVGDKAFDCESITGVP